MSSSHPKGALIDRFSIPEKVLMRAGWYGFMAIGALGIYRQDPLWSLFYLVYGVAGFALVVLPGLCAHCPYPYQYSTCLFFPVNVLQRFYPYKGPKMSPMGKVTVGAVMTGMVILPQFWLIRDFGLLAAFWLLALPVLAVFPRHYCRRCRHLGCPMNRVAGQKVASHETGRNRA